MVRPFFERDEFITTCTNLLADPIRVPTAEGFQKDAFTACLFYLAMATGILVSLDFLLGLDISTKLAQNAFPLLPSVPTSSRAIDSVQYLTALVIHSMYSASGGSTGHLMGLTVGRLFSNSMHRATVSD